jgi:hypothetical protein
MADETSSLLRPTAATSSHESSGVEVDCAEQQQEIKSLLYPPLIIFIILLAAVADGGGALINTPEIRLEMAVC